jgi:hypothetical protein
MHWHHPWSVYDETHRSNAPPPAKLRLSDGPILLPRDVCRNSGTPPPSRCSVFRKPAAPPPAAGFFVSRTFPAADRLSAPVPTSRHPLNRRRLPLESAGGSLEAPVADLDSDVPKKKSIFRGAMSRIGAISAQQPTQPNVSVSRVVVRRPRNGVGEVAVGYDIIHEGGAGRQSGSL